MNAHRRAFAGLRTLVLEPGGGSASLAGLAGLAGLLGRTPAATTQWMLAANDRLGERRPIDVWLEGRPDQVIDAARSA